MFNTPPVILVTVNESSCFFLNATVIVSKSVRVTLAGMICTSLSLYTDIFTFLVSKLCDTATDVWFEKVLDIVAACETVMLVKRDPSPTK